MLGSESEVQFSEGAEAPEVEDYRPISRLAVLALACSILSFVALINPLLWVVPVVSIVLAIAALRSLSAPDSRHGGKSLAILALSVACLVAGYAPTRLLLRQQVIYAQAREFNEAWLRLLCEQRVQEAHQLSLLEAERFKGPESLSELYAGEVMPTNVSQEEVEELSPSKALAAYRERPAIQKLLSLSKDARVHFVQNESIQRCEGGVFVTQRFSVDNANASSPKHLVLRIRSRRLNLDEEEANWQLGETVELIE